MGKSNLRVLMVHIDPCIRVLKEVQALVQAGVTIDILCLSCNLTPQLRELVGSVYIEPDVQQFHAFLRDRGTQWDIIHCHNEPNFITALALDACPARPVIYDCHDMTSARSTLTEQEAALEKLCFTQSRGIVHVSEGLKKIAFAKYGPTLSIVLPSYPLASESRIGAQKKLPGKHVVYQGTLSGPEDPRYIYRFYFPMFEKLVASGVHLHMYPTKTASDAVLRPYKELSQQNRRLHVHNSLPYSELIATMSQYQWGFSGFNFDGIPSSDTINFLNSALPNKFFDYLLAGVCPIVINNATTAEFAVRHGLGYAAKNMDDFVSICLTQQPRPPLADQALIDMQTQIDRLLALYAAVL